MTVTDERQDQLIRKLVAEPRLPETVAGPDGLAARELMYAILNTRREPARGPLLNRRRLTVLVPAAAALAVFVALGTAVLPATWPGGIGTAHAEPLKIVRDGDYYDVSIIDAGADAVQYTAQFKQLGLNVDLKLAQAPADLVGKVVVLEVGDTGNGPSIQEIEAPGHCSANGGCGVRLLIPVSFHTYAHIVIGRTPTAAEMNSNQETGDAPVLSGQERRFLDGLVGQRVSDARAALTAHGWTAEYRVGFYSRAATAGQVPGNWYVTDEVPLSHRRVVLWAAP